MVPRRRRCHPARTEPRAALVKLLQAAHAGELAAANAYRGHWSTLSDGRERAEVQRIEAAELVHRAEVGELLAQLGARPQRWREVAMGTVGAVFGWACRFAGWFLPMFVAGRLEAMNVGQYGTAAAQAEAAGLPAAAARLEEMVAEEQRHEEFFASCVRGHPLTPLAGRLLGWRPAPAPVTPVAAPPAVP